MRDNNVKRGYQMRSIIIALLLVLATGACEASTLQGGDENTTVVLFAATRTPYEADENGTTELLKLDVGIMGSDNATYQLIDADGNILLPGLYSPLASGRQLVYFLIPKDSLFKLLNVTPIGGKSIYFNWWVTPKGSSDKVVLRYYGISDWLLNPDEQGIVVQLRVTNNGSENITVSPENFTLFDQWGWPYSPTAGFESEVVAPGDAQKERVLVGFTGVSLLSRPAALAYDFNTPHQVVIDFERDYVPLSDELVYGKAAVNAAGSSLNASSNATGSADQAAATSNVAESASASTTANTAAATSAATSATAPTTEAASGAASAPSGGLSIKDQLAESRARLNATKQNLDAQTSEDTSSASSSRDDI